MFIIDYTERVDMSGTELIIKIDMTYFLGIIGTILTLAWIFSKKVSAIETSITWIKRELGRLWEGISSMESRLAGAEGRKSPLNPTKLGWRWLNESGLAKIIDEEKKTWLLQNLQNLLPPNYTDYDVQEVARRVMVSLKDDSLMIEIKQYAFEQGIDVEMLLRLGGLLLRDNFLGWKHTIISSTQRITK